MKDILEEYYKPFLSEHGFSLASDNNKNNTIGLTWEVSKDIGVGTYWIYSK